MKLPLQIDHFVCQSWLILEPLFRQEATSADYFVHPSVVRVSSVSVYFSPEHFIFIKNPPVNDAVVPQLSDHAQQQQQFNHNQQSLNNNLSWNLIRSGKDGGKGWKKEVGEKEKERYMAWSKILKHCQILDLLKAFV